MDQPAVSNANQVDPSQALSAKKRVEKEVLETIMNGLSNGEVSSQAAQEIARDSLAALKMLDEHEESLEKFYMDLSTKYPIFNLLYTRIRGEVFRSREVSAHRQALAAINEGKLEEAHQIAKGAIAQTAHEATDVK